jgi:hypothetical protein
LDHTAGVIVDEIAVLFEIDLNARLRFVKIRLARDVDDGQHRHERNDAEHQPETFADRAPVVEQVYFVLGVGIDAVVVRLRRLDGRSSASNGVSRLTSSLGVS